MLKFIFVFSLGAISSLFLYACILAGAKADKEDSKCQKKDITG